jgi:hypothetical protein
MNKFPHHYLDHSQSCFHLVLQNHIPDMYWSHRTYTEKVLVFITYFDYIDKNLLKHMQFLNCLWTLWYKSS